MPRDTYDMFSDPERGRFGENELKPAKKHFAGERATGIPVADKYGARYGKPPKGRLTDVTLVFHRESKEAVMVSQNGDDTRAVWLPKSLIQIEMLGQPAKDRNGKPARACQVTLPEWKAKQAGLI